MWGVRAETTPLHCMLTGRIWGGCVLCSRTTDFTAPVQDHAKWGVTAPGPPQCCGQPSRGSPLGATVCFADLNRWVGGGGVCVTWTPAPLSVAAGENQWDPSLVAGGPEPALPLPAVRPAPDGLLGCFGPVCATEVNASCGSCFEVLRAFPPGPDA